jgi:alpha-glucosidase
VHPHHDGSASYVPQQAPTLGETVDVFVRVPSGADVQQMHVRTTGDGEPRFREATVDRVEGDSVWWRAAVEARNPVSNYRFLLSGRRGPRWLSAAGLVDHDVPDHGDFKLVTHAAPPAWARDAVIYQIFPDRFARSAAADDRARCRTGRSRATGTPRSSGGARRRHASSTVATWTGSPSGWTTWTSSG